MDLLFPISNEADFQRWLVLILNRERQRLAAEIAARDADQMNEFNAIAEISSREGVSA
jgi:hypothetical protein